MNRLYRSRVSASALLWLAFVVLLVVAVVSAGAVTRNHDLKGQRAQVGQLQQQVQALQTHGAALQTQVDAAAGFAQAVEPFAVAGRLSGEPVVVVVAPDAPKSVLDATVQSLADAGATVTGVIDVRPSFVDPTQVTNLGELATSLGASTASENVSARASALLASALVGQPPAGSSATGTLDAASTEALAGLAQGGFISVVKQPTQHARLAVIVAPTPASTPSSPTGSATAVRAALVDLVAAFPAAGGATVVAGATGSAADGGLVAALRVGAPAGSATASASSAGVAAVSTVDDAERPAGTIAVIMALQAEQAQPGSPAAVGHYGSGPGARALLPAPPPS